MIMTTFRIDGNQRYSLDKEPAITVREPDATMQPTLQDDSTDVESAAFSASSRQLRLEMARPERPETKQISATIAPNLADSIAQ